MNTASGGFNLGAISIDSTRTANTSIGDSSTTVAGTLRLYGATVNSVSDVVLRNAGTGLLTLQAAQTSVPMSLALNDATANKIYIDNTGGITISANISGNAPTLLGAGSGVFTLGGTNTFSPGGWSVNPGYTLQILDTTSPIGAGTLTLNGGTFIRGAQNTSATRAFANTNPISVTASSIMETTTTTTRTFLLDAPFSGTAGTTLILTNTASPGVGHFRFFANSINYAGNIVIATGGGGTAQLESYVTNNATPGTEQVFTGLISGSGLVYKNVESPNPGGNLIFSNANNTYSGGTDIRAGFVGLGAANCLGSGNVLYAYDTNYLGLYAVGAARTLTNDVTVDTTVASSVASSTNFVIKGSQNLTLAGRFLINSNLTQLIISNTATTTISGPITNAFATAQGIYKTGPGTLVLSGANTFSGSAIVGSGTLALTGSGSINNATNLTVVGGATLDVSGLSSGLTLSSSQSFSGVATNSATGTIILSGTAGLTLGSTSPLALAYTNGTPVLAVTNGTLTLASGNVATVTVANGGVGLPAGSYPLISTSTGGSVSGTAPTSVTVNGDGISGSSPSLVISNSQLYLLIAPSANPPAAPPVANAASSTNVTGFTASWSAASGATGYQLDVSTVNNFSSFVSGYSNLDVGGTISYAVTGLSANTTYYYQVRAYNANGTTANSSTITVTTPVGPYVWNAGSGNWSATGSWQFGSVPVNGVATGFTGAGGNSINDLTSLLLNSLTFSNGAGAYVISGNPLVVSNGIVNNSSASETISAPLTLGAAETFSAISGPLTFSGPVTNAGNLLTLNAAANITNSGVISGAGALVKTGAGTLLLSATNTFTGATTNNAGTLQLSGGAALAASPVTLANVAGVTLGLSDNESIASLAGGGATGGTVALGANNLYVTSGTTTNSGAVAGTGKLIKTGTGTLSLASASAIGPSFTLRVEGGTLDLNRGASPLIGILGAGNIIELAGGTLQLSASVQANFGFAAEEIDIYSNSTIFFNRTGTTSSQSPTNSSPLNFINSATLSFGYSATVTNGTTLFDAASHTLQGNATFALGSYAVTIQNPINESGGSFGITKTGVGELNLNGINTYSGNTTNLQGTLAVNGTSTLGNGTGTLVFAGGNLLDANTRYPAPIANPIQLIYSGTNTIYGNSTVGGSRYLPFSGPLSGSVGTLEIRNEGSGAAGTFIVNLTAGGFAFSQPIIVGDAADTVGATSILSFNNDNTGTQEFDGIISGTGSVVRGVAYDGGSAGITILTGANTYSGGTTISSTNNATLLVNNTSGSGTGTNTVSVSSGGTLGGTGTIAGVVTVAAGGTISPGSSGLGTLTLSNAPIFAGTNLMGINRNSGLPLADELVLTTGTFTYGGTLTVTNAGATLANGDSFTLYSAPAYSGWFSAVNLPALATGLTWDTNGLANTGALTVYAFTTNAFQTMAVVQNTSAALSISKVLAKTSGGRGTLTLVSAGNGTSGTVTTNATSITYTPTTGYVGPDSFNCVVQDVNGATTTLQVLVTVNAVNASGNISTLDTSVPGQVTVTASGIPGTPYTVQYSDDSGTTWNTLGMATAAANGVVSYVDTNPNPTMRWYRLAQ